MSNPLHKRKAPLLKTFWPQFWQTFSCVFWWCTSMPIYISQYGNVADVSYQWWNSTNTYWEYLLTKLLCYCSAQSVWKPNFFFIRDWL